MSETQRDNQLKMVIVIRKDLNMRKGKMVAQGAHSAVTNVVDLIKRYGFDPDSDWYQWYYGNNFEQKKITVSVANEQELLSLYSRLSQTSLPVSLITDHGLTEFNGVHTHTALAVGPALDTAIDTHTGHLPLL
jgi:PTH2 family peptidyl-tRNA hydrolase